MVLTALVLLPVAGVGVLAQREVGERAEIASSAGAIADETEGFVAVADLRAVVINEQLYAIADLALGGGGIALDAKVVVAVFGTDLAARRDEMADAVDRAYARADTLVLGPSIAGHGPLNVPHAVELRDGYAALRGLQQQIATHRTSIDEATRAYGRLGASGKVALDDMASKLDSAAARITAADGLARRINAINKHIALSATLSAEVTSTAGLVLGQLFAQVPLAQSQSVPSQRSDVVFTIARREVAVMELGETLDGADRSLWEAGRVDLRVVRFEAALDALGRGADVGSVDIAQLASDGLARLDLHDALLPRLLDGVRARAERARTDAVQSRDATLIALAAWTLGTLLALTVAAALISRPLRRLRRRARLVRDGSLAPADRVRGAIAEIFGVQLVFEEIVGNLRLIETQATAIVEGRLDDELVTVAQPGPLGQSVQASLQRLAEVTQRLQASEALSNAIVETAAEAIWAINAFGFIERANAASEELILVASQDLLGRPFLELIDEADRAALALVMASGDLESVEVRMRRGRSAIVHVLLSSSEVILGGDRFTTVIARDITERKDFEEQLGQNAATDSLTGLPNRRTAVAAIADSLSVTRDSPGVGVGVVFCDLDGFKQANDLYGHAFGDEVLCEIARRFASITRDQEMLARLGGDEFVVVVRGASGIDEPSQLAGRLLASLGDTVTVGDRRVRVSGSFGVAWNDGTAAVSDILREADAAMFTAKAAGGARVQQFDESLQQSLRDRLEMEAGLRQALAENELHFVYQPILAAGTHEVVGVEALVRWECPGRGTVSPVDFIEVAEQSDLIVDIGRWGLRAAARQLAAWDIAFDHPSFYVAVNIAGVHLSRYDIVADVEAAIRDAGISPDRLRIEITETQLVDDLHVAADAMRQLAALGVSVVIDDYGTGFSSIAYLRELPLRAIKIDRTFISQLTNDRDLAMVESVVTLANLLQLEVVAEGIETAEQLALAEQIGCGSLQGYLIARPMPAAALETWLRREVPFARETTR